MVACSPGWPAKRTVGGSRTRRRLHSRSAALHSPSPAPGRNAAPARLAVDRLLPARRSGADGRRSDAVEVEIDPMVGAAPFGQPSSAVEVARGRSSTGKASGTAAGHGDSAAASLHRLRCALSFAIARCWRASAFAFEPVGWWPLMPLAFAALCELVARAGSLRRALLIGWLFGLGQFVVGLNWIATAFTYQAAMPAWLGWVAVVLLSLYLAIYPALAAGPRLAVRPGRAGSRWCSRWPAPGRSPNGCARPCSPASPGTRSASALVADAADRGISALIGTYGLSALVVLLGGAHLARLPSQVAARWSRSSARPRCLWLLPASARRRRSARRSKPIRIVQPNIGQQDKWRPGFADEAARRLDRAVGQPGGRRRACCSGPRRRSPTRSRTRGSRAPGATPSSSGRAPPRRSGPAICC